MSGLTVFYVVGVLLWEVARASPLARFWAFEMADIFGVWLYLPVPGLLVLLVLGAPRFTLLLLVPLALFLREYSEAFVPKRSVADMSTGVAPLRVMSANVVWENDRADAFAAVARREDPDVIAVQELGHAMAEGLAHELGREYPHQALFPSGAPDGLGLLSRTPLESVEPADIGVPGPGPCYCQAATLRLGGRLVTVLNAHPGPPAVGFRRVGPVPVPASFDSREQDVARAKLLNRIHRIDGPLVVAGDLNTADRQPYYRMLRARLRDAFREGGWGFGWTFPSAPAFPSPLPLVRIDYVLTSEDWLATAAHTGHLDESDHRYVVADLFLGKEQDFGALPVFVDSPQPIASAEAAGVWPSGRQQELTSAP